MQKIHDEQNIEILNKVKTQPYTYPPRNSGLLLWEYKNTSSGNFSRLSST